MPRTQYDLYKGLIEQLSSLSPKVLSDIARPRTVYDQQKTDEFMANKAGYEQNNPVILAKQGPVRSQGSLLWDMAKLMNQDQVRPGMSGGMAGVDTSHLWTDPNREVRKWNWMEGWRPGQTVQITNENAPGGPISKEQKQMVQKELEGSLLGKPEVGGYLHSLMQMRNILPDPLSEGRGSYVIRENEMFDQPRKGEKDTLTKMVAGLPKETRQQIQNEMTSTGKHPRDGLLASMAGMLDADKYFGGPGGAGKFSDLWSDPSYNEERIWGWAEGLKATPRGQYEEGTKPSLVNYLRGSAEDKKWRHIKSKGDPSTGADLFPGYGIMAGAVGGIARGIGGR